MNRISTAILALFVSAAIAAQVDAGLIIRNSSNTTIDVTWVMTFGPHIYSNTTTLKPGHQFEITGGFNPERTYWLSIRRHDNNRRLKLDHDFKDESGRVFARAKTSRMWYFSSPDFTNAFVAAEMRKGNWEPFLSNVHGTGPNDCIRLRSELGGGDRGGALTIRNDGTYNLRTW